MKKLVFNCRFIFLSILLFFECSCFAQSWIETCPEITISGTSNIHDWEAISKSGSVRFSAVFDDNQLIQINEIQVSIPVISLKSDKGKNLDERMHKSLKFDQFPEIKFSLHQVGKNVSINEMGELIILGFLNFK